MRFNELYNQKILEFISENRCDLSNLSLQKINSNIYSFINLIELNLSENQIFHISSILYFYPFILKIMPTSAERQPCLFVTPSAAYLIL